MRHERGHSRRSQGVRRGAGLPSARGIVQDDTVSAIRDANTSTQDISVDPFQQHDGLEIRSEILDHSTSSAFHSTPRQMPLTSCFAADAVTALDLQFGWGASHDAEMPYFEAAYGDPFWFMGDEFCLDALNSLISTAASPKTSAAPDMLLNTASGLGSHSSNQPAVPCVDISAASKSSLRTVQGCWYTTPNASDAPLLLLASLRNQDHIDATYRTGLSSRLTIHPHDDTLPSVEFLVFSPTSTFAPIGFSDAQVNNLIPVLT